MSSWLRLAAILLAPIVAWQLWSRSTDLAAPAASGTAESTPGTGSVPPAAAPYPAFLPPEAVATLEAIERGGPFPYDRDGSVFQNRERRLPERPRGHYREYTVESPGAPDRGARRIVSGGDPPQEFFYTDDHYRSFRRIEIGS